MDEIDTYLITQNNAAGPIILPEEIPVSIFLAEDSEGNVTWSSAVAYGLAYAIPLCVIVYFIWFT